MGGPWEDYGGTTTATAEHGPWEDYAAAAPTKRPVVSPIAPPPVPRPQVNMQPMSVSDVINAATGHPGYQAPPLTPITIAQGTAHDVGTLMRAGPQAMVKALTRRPLLGEPPRNEDVINAAANIGQGYLLGGIEAAERPSIPRTAKAGTVPEVLQQPTAMQQLPPEQYAKVQAQIDKANKPFVEYQQAQDLAMQKQQHAAVVQQDVRTLHGQVRGALENRADQMRAATEQVTRPTKPIEGAIENARTELSGVPADLRIFNQIMQTIEQPGREAQAAIYADALGQGATLEEAQAAVPNLPPTELPFRDLQRQFSALNEQWADAEGNVKRVLGQVRDVYARELKAGAESVGQGKTWDALRSDWAQYYKDWRGTGPLAKVLKAPHPDYVAPIVTGRPGNLLRETYARYGDPRSIVQLQQLVNQPPPPPAPVQLPPPEPPTPSVAKRIAMHIPRVAGKLIGGKIGTAVGHPLIGYGVGGEVGGEIGRKLTQPPTPESYARRLAVEQESMRLAKEGKISPGEADRRITRAGGRVKIRPIPQQEREQPTR